MHENNYPVDKASHDTGPMQSVGPVSAAVEDSYPVWRQREIVNQFTYHSPTPSQAVKLNLIREAGKMLALTILANTPPGDEQANAIANVRVATMFANASIVAGK